MVGGFLSEKKTAVWKFRYYKKNFRSSMDAILDLTSRAVSLIELIQDSLLRIKKNNRIDISQSAGDNLFHEFVVFKKDIIDLKYFRDNGTKISWVSVEPLSSEILTTEYCYDRCFHLIKWINKKQNLIIFQQDFSTCKYFPGPEQWRKAIRTVLYTHKAERSKLADALQYLPIQIVLTAENVASTLNAKQQRLLQIWNVENAAELEKIISPKDMLKYDELESTRSTIKSTADEYLKDEEKLINELEKREVPLSFLQIFNCELLEVHQSRRCRKNEITNSDKLFSLTTDNDILPINKPVDSGKSIEGDKSDDFHKIFEFALTESSNLATKDKMPANHLKQSDLKTNYIPDTRYAHDYGKDVLQSAEKMDLWALAFSGGGIRSATFNLGVLQGLAKKGLLGKFDYLSTVSGGGYIGSWLISWIARNRSVIKVSDRLDPKKSSDPLADEVLPIRWLRMYSNYLSPRTGIMSADSWTVGMTIIRNMLINQLVILSLFLTLIALGKMAFLTWEHLTMIKLSQYGIFNSKTVFNLVGSIVLLISAFFAGLGMHSYHKERFPNINVSPWLKNKLAHSLIVTACIAALAFSAWIFGHAKTNNAIIFRDFANTFAYFYWLMGIAFLALLVIALFGRYDRCFGYKGEQLYGEYILATVLSAVAVAVGGGLLALVGHIAVIMADPSTGLHFINQYPEKLSFIFLPPLIIEVFSVTVVLRMAFLGINFPDERREWWGRIGGLIHRICLIWIVLFGISMMGIELINQLKSNWFPIKEFFVVGWGATLLLGIKYAFSGSTSGNETGKTKIVGAKEVLTLLAPYLFVFALMTILPQLVDNIQTVLFNLLNKYFTITKTLTIIPLALVLGLITYVLARQIGVNQFSLHLFYKNRLVRAFLGATRIRLERQRSANPFTGFDNNDDLPLATLLNENDYFGPYPLINTTMSASSDTVLDRQDRKAESFVFSPIFSGFDFSRTRESANATSKSYDYAYRPTAKYSKTGGPHIGTAMAISGAAANPNMGYHTAPLTAFLLSIFNIRLGWWMGNPRMSKWQQADPDFGLGYLISDLTGNTNTSKNFVCLSDGGHFDNMGLYELIRRKCRYIVLSDAEQDETLLCEGLANAVRRCRIDFGVEITFSDIEDITNLNKQFFSKKNYTLGKIKYPENLSQEGILIYIKASMAVKENIDLQEYKKRNPTYPHQTTADQFFDEEQFESYRKLGMNIVDKIIP